MPSAPRRRPSSDLAPSSRSLCGAPKGHQERTLASSPPTWLEMLLYGGRRRSRLGLRTVTSGSRPHHAWILPACLKLDSWHGGAGAMSEEDQIHRARSEQVWWRRGSPQVPPGTSPTAHLALDRHRRLIRRGDATPPASTHAIRHRHPSDLFLPKSHFFGRRRNGVRDGNRTCAVWCAGVPRERRARMKSHSRRTDEGNVGSQGEGRTDGATIGDCPSGNQVADIR